MYKKQNNIISLTIFLRAEKCQIGATNPPLPLWTCFHSPALTLRSAIDIKNDTGVRHFLTRSNNYSRGCKYKTYLFSPLPWPPPKETNTRRDATFIHQDPRRRLFKHYPSGAEWEGENSTLSRAGFSAWVLLLAGWATRVHKKLWFWQYKTANSKQHLVLLLLFVSICLSHK